MTARQGFCVRTEQKLFENIFFLETQCDTLHHLIQNAVDQATTTTMSMRNLERLNKMLT